MPNIGGPYRPLVWQNAKQEFPLSIHPWSCSSGYELCFALGKSLGAALQATMTSGRLKAYGGVPIELLYF
jgi:hypothetical protein